MVLFPKRQPRRARVQPALLNFNLAVLALAALLLPVAARPQGTCVATGTSNACTGSTASCTCTSTDVILAPVAWNNPPGVPSTHYPSIIQVPSAVTGTVSSVQVQLNNMYSDGTGVYNSLAATEIMLESPSGKQMELLGQVGDGYEEGSYSAYDYCGLTAHQVNTLPTGTCGLQGLTILFGDHTSSTFPYISNGNVGSPTPLPQTGTQHYAPGSYWTSDEGFTFGQYPGPAGATVNYPQTLGSATFANTFANGAEAVPASGTAGWRLYMFDSYGDPVQINGWMLILTVNVSATGTTTTVTSNVNPAVPGDAVTLTATVTYGDPAVTVPGGGTVAFYANGSGTPISGCGAQSVNSNGEATCETTLAAGSSGQCSSATLPTWPTVCQGANTITASYSGNGSYNGGTSSSFTELVEETAVNTTGTTWCNNDALYNPGNATPPRAYPSVIKVPDYSGQTVSDVSVTLNGVTGSQQGIGGQFLLVAPGGGAHNLDFMDSVFSTDAPTSAVNLTFEDSASSYAPGGDVTPASGSYLPSDQNDFENLDAFPAGSAQISDSSIPQVPGTLNFALPYGDTNLTYRPYTNIYTFGQAFSGAPATGAWSLYTYSGNAISLDSGWCITLDVNSGAGTTTTVTSSQQKGTTGQPITLTATVTLTAGGAPVTSGGTVTFTDETTSTTLQSGVPVNTTTGQATTNSITSLSEGDHLISAVYSGTASDNPSDSSPFWQREDNATAVTNPSANTWQFCNAGKVTIGPSVPGAFTPNPSNIFVKSLPGAFQSMTLTLNNFSVPDGGQLDAIASMIEGPTGAALDFFSDTGDSEVETQIANAGAYIFADGNPTVPDTSANLNPGTYEPTAYEYWAGGPDTFHPSSGGTYSGSTFTPFYPLPSAICYAQPYGYAGCGSSAHYDFTEGTDNVFGGKDPIGTWSLFLTKNGEGGGSETEGAMNGWCLDLTETPPMVTVNASHSPSSFSQGEQSAEITVGITNNGAGSTGDPTGGSAPMTVTDTLNSAFTYVSGSGTNWSCSNSGQTVTCTNDAAVAASNSYPTLTIDVNVSDSATGPISNSVSAAGAGVSSTGSNSNSITIVPAPVLSVSKTHTGTFTQGSTAQWNIVVSNAAGSGATSGTVTVADTLPTGYTLASYTGTGWSCGGTTTVTCTSSQGVSGGSSYPTIQVNVDVPATSPTSVTNTALAWGGGDLTHTNSGNAASGTDSNVTVVQVPASITINGGGTQSATIGTAFGTGLAVTVKDAAGVAIQGSSVTFTAPASGASGTFSDSSATTTVSTGATGVANAGMFTANGTAGGPYSVTVTDSPAAPVSFSLTNTKATETVTLGSLAQNYTGSPLAATATTSPVSGLTVTFTYTGISPTTYATSSTPPAAVGSYTVVGTISDPNYQGSATGTLVISSTAATVTLGSLAQNYTGSPLAATATTSPTGLTVNFTYTGISPTTYATSSTPPTAAGSYTVVGTISSSTYTGSATGTLVISPATETVTLGSLAQNYTGSPLSATATTSPVSGLTVTFTYTGTSGTTYPTSSNPPTAAGSYTVVGAISNPNYQGSATGTLVISPATETVTLGSLAQTYTGSPLSATATTSPVSGLTVTFTYTGISPTTYATSPTPPTAAGSYTVVGAISSSNYQGSATGTLVISKATATVNLGSLAQTYAGVPLAATATTSSPSGLTVTFTYTGISPTTYATSSTPPTAAGSYTVVGAISNPNYAGSATGTLVIAPALLTVTANNASMTVGAAVPALTASYNGFVPGDSAAVLSGSPTLSTTATSSSPAGLYPITVVQGTLSAANYTFAFVNGTLTDVQSGTTVVITASASLSGSASAGYTATITVVNSGSGPATNVKLTTASLGSAAGSPLPQSLGTLAAGGGSATITLNFPGSAGSDGARTVASFAGTFTGGTFSGGGRTVLP
jgi:hypothetical protein